MKEYSTLNKTRVTEGCNVEIGFDFLTLDYSGYKIQAVFPYGELFNMSELEYNWEVEELEKSIFRKIYERN